MSRQGAREPRVVFGFHAVLARLRADPSSVLEIYLDETRNDARAKDLAAVAERAKVHLMRVPTRRLDGVYGGGRHQGRVARLERKKTADAGAAAGPRASSPASRSRRLRIPWMKSWRAWNIRCSSCSTASPTRTTWAPA